MSTPAQPPIDPNTGQPYPQVQNPFGTATTPPAGTAEAPAQAAWSAQQPGYGAPKPSPYTSPEHGGAAAAPGVPAAPGFGTAPAAPVYGGAPAAPGYGSPSAPPVYGGAPAAPAYGTVPTTPGYGTAPTAPGYGAAPGYPAAAGFAGPPLPTAPGFAAPYEQQVMPQLGAIVDGPAAPRSQKLGTIAFFLALAAAIIPAIIAGITAVPIGQTFAEALANGVVPDGVEWLSPVKSTVLVAELAFWFGTIAGIAAIIMGAIAMGQQRGRKMGLIAIIVAVAGPILYAVVLFSVFGITAAA